MTQYSPNHPFYYAIPLLNTLQTISQTLVIKLKNFRLVLKSYIISCCLHLYPPLSPVHRLYVLLLPAFYSFISLRAALLLSYLTSPHKYLLFLPKVSSNTTSSRECSLIQCLISIYPFKSLLDAIYTFL